MVQKPATRIGELHTAGMANEQGNANLIFQIADPSADRRFPNTEFGGSLGRVLDDVEIAVAASPVWGT